MVSSPVRNINIYVTYDVFQVEEAICIVCRYICAFNEIPLQEAVKK